VSAVTLPPMIGDKITTSQGDFAVVGLTTKKSRTGVDLSIVLAAKWGEEISPVVVMAASDLAWQPGANCWRHKTQSRILLAT
jgi:hypothetical protein